MTSLTRRALAWTCACGLLGAVLLNLAAYAHVHRMTHFLEQGTATPSPGELGPLERLTTLLVGIELPRPRNDTTPASLELPFETLHLPTTDGLTLEAWWIPRPGATDLALLFHGYGASKQSTLREAQALGRLGFNTLLVDLRGAGGSEGLVTTLGWHEAQDVVAATRFARQRFAPERVLLYGASMGAVAILRAVAVHGLEADALLLEAPFNSLLDTTANRFHQMGLPAFPCAQLLVFWGGWQHDFDAFELAPESYLEAVRQPTLLLFGGADPDVTATDRHALLQRAPALVQSRTFSAAGHPRLLPQQRARWLREVEAFVSAALPR